ncbi:MAG: serine hydrolase [Gammaproteobacteria bacterium]
MMRFSTFVILLSTFLMAACTSHSQARSSAAPAAYAMPNSQVVPIKNSHNGGEYELYIKLPEDYAENQDTAYPVIYYADAVWHLEMLSAATQYMLEDVILVGISWRQDIADDLKEKYGNHASRFTDYSFWEKANPNHPKLIFGQAKNHLAFIRDDVIRYVDDTYRTEPDSRTYFGYSLSGAFGAYALLTQPESFDNYILGSPLDSGLISYLADIDSELGTFEANNNDSLNANVFIAYGTLEEGAPEATDDFIKDFIKLLGNQRKLGLSIQTQALEGDHETAFPRVSLESVAWLSSLISKISSDDPELSFREVPILNKAFISSAPEDRKDGIAVGALGVDAGDKERILALAQEIADHKHGRFDSFLIAHKDKLIFESYYARGRIDLPHFQASATKAYTGLLLGRAIQLGYLTMEDLDKPLVSFLKDLDSAKFVDGAESITLNHALTMRSGIRISDEQKQKMEENPDRLKGQGEVQALLEHSAPITEESQVFKYAGGPGLVMQVIEAVVPGSAQDFAKSELLDKLGIENYRWPIHEPTGLPVSGSRAQLTSRDMLKFGTLASNNGKYNGEQLIPQAFVGKAIARILTTDSDYEVHYGGKDVSNQGYGYFWWSADLNSDHRNYFTSSAQGGYGQFIILIDELDLMVVFTAHDNETNYLQLTAERILPAFID